MDKARRRKIVAGAALAVIGVSVAAAVSNHRPSKGAAKSDALAPQAALASATAGAQSSAAGAVAPATGAQGAVAAYPPGQAAPSRSVVAGVPGAPGQRPGVVANVPLFGPTTMATLEPAPLGPPPDELATAAPVPAPRVTEERMDEDEAPSGAHDEVFDDGESSKKKQSDDKSAEAKAAAVQPWGQGRLHLPIIHRMKLDHPGIAIVGKKEPGGFSVELPGRRVLDGGSAIPKRDDRIAEVRTKNGPNGARVTFIFRSKIPSYKVRLRRNYVEFFISSPDSVK